MDDIEGMVQISLTDLSMELALARLSGFRDCENGEEEPGIPELMMTYSRLITESNNETDRQLN